VVFSAESAPVAQLERAAEAAMTRHLGRAFLTIVPPVDALRKSLAADPYRSIRLRAGSKRVVTFVRGRTKGLPPLPLELHGSRAKVDR
jgi:uncharacterized protein (DUF1697 family)